MTPNLDQERVERAARAIYEGRNGKGCKPWSLQTKAHKEPYLLDARAAIAAYQGDDAQGYADSLRQQAQWIDDTVAGRGPIHSRIDLADVDTDELRAAANLLSTTPTVNGKGE